MNRKPQNSTTEEERDILGPWNSLEGRAALQVPFSCRRLLLGPRGSTVWGRAALQVPLSSYDLVTVWAHPGGSQQLTWYYSSQLQIFSHSVDHFVKCFFHCVNGFNSVLFVDFCFYSFAFGYKYKNTLLWFMWNSDLIMFSSLSLMVTGLAFRPLIYLEFAFVSGGRKCPVLILMCAVIQFSQHQWLRNFQDTFFSL